MSALAGLNPGLWIDGTANLRAKERRLMELWAGEGYAEVIPPLFLPEEAARAASPEALLARTLHVPANGEGGLALRADFTAGVAWMTSRRLTSLQSPLRLAYSGTVLRKPAADLSEAIETLQAGCERISPASGPEGDEEVARLAARSLLALGLEDSVLELGHWALVGPILERIPWPSAGRLALEQALNRKSIPALDVLGERHGRCPEWSLLRDLVHLGGRPEAVDDLRPALRAAGVEETWEELRWLGRSLSAEFPGLPVRLEPTDVRHWAYYSGLTVKAFTPRHSFAVLSGGRYDGLYAALGRPFGACGFAVHLGRLLEE
jgi:ATP phosphoribosyltransferase regulatory subunit